MKISQLPVQFQGRIAEACRRGRRRQRARRRRRSRRRPAWARWARRRRAAWPAAAGRRAAPTGAPCRPPTPTAGGRARWPATTRRPYGRAAPRPARHGTDLILVNFQHGSCKASCLCFPNIHKLTHLREVRLSNT